MRLLRIGVWVAALAATAANAQTAGGPDRASPGAMPADTPLTSSGAPRTGAATPATPASIGANKPARPHRMRHRRAHHAAAPAQPATPQ